MIIYISELRPDLPDAMCDIAVSAKTSVGQNP